MSVNTLANLATIFACIIALLLWLEIRPSTVRGWFGNTQDGLLVMPVPRSKNKVIFGLIAVTWIWCGITTYRLHDSANSFKPTDDISHLEVITGKTFRNEVVVLDGKKYINCRFEHVTVKYNATTPPQMSNNTWVAPIGFKTDNPTVTYTFATLKGLGFIKQGIPMLDKDGVAVDVHDPSTAGVK